MLCIAIACVTDRIPKATQALLHVQLPVEIGATLQEHCQEKHFLHFDSIIFIIYHLNSYFKSTDYNSALVKT